MISMLRYLADHDLVRDIIFYHQCRTQADIPYLEELKTLEKQFPQLKVMIALSRPDKKWKGLSGRLEASHLEKLEALGERQVFVCGPNRFMDDAKTLLLNAGLDAAQYHQEAFGPLTREVNKTKEVTISINGNLFSGDNQKTLLEQAEAAGSMFQTVAVLDSVGRAK